MHPVLLSALTSALILGPHRSLAASEVSKLASAAIWQGDATSENRGFAREIGRLVQSAGWEIEFLDSAALTNVTQLTADRYGLLVLPGARRLPMESIASIQSYLGAGGDMIALGLPAWDTPVFSLGDRWMTRDEYEAALADQKPRRYLLRFAPEPQTQDQPSDTSRIEPAPVPTDSATLERYSRHTNLPDARAVRTVDKGQNGGALHVTLDRLEGWETLEPPSQAWPFAPDHTLTCFEAKGSANTRQLAVEWIEQDSSRWIATVGLAPEWRRYALPPESFRPWQPPAGRGGPGDRVNLGRLARFTLGLALTHTSVEPGKQEYWFANLGTAPNPFGAASAPATLPVPRIESFAPDYMVYPVGTAVTIRPPRWQALLRSNSPDAAQTGAAAVDGVAIPAGQSLVAMHPRPRGVGFDQDRPYRWQPILEARDLETADFRGTVAALIAHLKPPYRDSVWALFTPDDPAFYRRPSVADWIEQTARRLRTPVYLAEGGSQFFTLFPDQAAPIGARVANVGGRAATNLQVVLTVSDRRRRTPIHRHQEALNVEAHGTAIVTNAWTPGPWPEQGCVVAAQLLEDNRVIDELRHDLNRWEPKAKPEFLEARDGAFWIAGRRWKAHGVNYMPSSGIGVVSAFFEYWLGRGAYDPEVIGRDLRRIKAMGLNSISAFVYHRDLRAQHLLDLLFQCEQLDLKVNLSLRPGTPMDFRWDEMRALIEHYRLARNDTVIAYDLAWEPSHYDQRHQQRHYTQAWADWVRRRHGSPAQALEAWGEQSTDSRPSTPSTDNTADVPVPAMSELTRDGPWRGRVADYRAFLDDLLAGKYAEARRLVRSIDPNHPVSFRMQHAGDPTYNAEGMLPYDFYGLRDAVDIWEPEAYGRIGDWERVKPGHFTAAYARLCDPAKPVLWSEMGYSVWNPQRRAPDRGRLEFAARYYRDFYRMLRESGADGVFFWWYPGGYRANENSDFGIIHPDGTDRPVTRAIRDEGPAFLAAPKPPPPTHWITVDRDRDARGLHGIYESVKTEYWSIVEASGPVGLRWKRTPGAR